MKLLRRLLNALGFLPRCLECGAQSTKTNLVMLGLYYEGWLCGPCSHRTFRDRRSSA